MKTKLFLDCGQFDGVAIEQYCVDDSWDIRSFELDPQPNLNLPPHELIQAAVWTEDGEIDFSIDPRKQASHIKGVAGTEYEEVRRVKTIDFSKYVDDLPPYDLVVCSMDIEGAEFPVLRKMIKDGTIMRFDVLDVEFHHRIMNNEDDNSARELTQQMWNLGIVVRQKIVLNK